MAKKLEPTDELVRVATYFALGMAIVIAIAVIRSPGKAKCTVLGGTAAECGTAKEGIIRDAAKDVFFAAALGVLARALWVLAAGASAGGVAIGITAGAVVLGAKGWLDNRAGRVQPGGAGSSPEHVLCQGHGGVDSVTGPRDVSGYPAKVVCKDGTSYAF